MARQYSGTLGKTANCKPAYPAPAVNLRQLAIAHAGQIRQVTWRHGTKAATGNPDALLTGEPADYWLSNPPADTPIEELVRLAKIRWRIERWP